MEPAGLQPQTEEASSRPRLLIARRASDRDSEKQLQTLCDALRAARGGDFSVRVHADGAAAGLSADVALAFNALLEQSHALVCELDRISRVVGSEGELGARASLGPVSGAWAAAIESVNVLIDRMAYPTAEATRVLRLVGEGELSRNMPEDVGGHP